MTLDIEMWLKLEIEIYACHGSDTKYVMVNVTEKMCHDGSDNGAFK